MPDNVEIQGLAFEIQSDSNSAVQGLNKLKSTLEGLKSATSGGVKGLSTTAKQLKSLSDAVNGINGSTASKLNALASSLKGLSSVGSIKISSSLANQINALSGALQKIKWTDQDKLAGLSEGLSSLENLGKARLTTFINQIGKLPEVVSKLDEVDIDKFTRQMKELAAALSPLASEMNKVSAGFSAFPSKVKSASKAMTGSKASSGLGKLFNFAGISTLVYKTSDLLSSAIVRSNSYQENLNLFTVAMGNYADSAYEYAEKVSDVMGIDVSDWIRNQAVFNTLATGFGATAERAQVMSRNLTQLGYDLSSFFNLPVEEAMLKLQSGISGELEPLRRLGFDLSQARLEAVALSLGIDQSVTSMTQAEKAELRYYAIMTQVTEAQGDLSRTLDAPANQLRVLSAQFNMAAREIGNIFIPALNAILPYAIAVVKVLGSVARSIASLFGFELTEVDYSGLSDSISSAASGSADLDDNLSGAASSAKQLKSYLTGIDELNVLSPDTGGGSGGGAGAVDTGGSGFDFELPEYDFLGDAVNQRVDEITQKLEPLVKFLEENAGDILEMVLTIAGTIWALKISDKFLKNLKKVKDYLSQGYKDLTGWNKALRVISGLVILSIGINWSYDAGYEIGRGTASLTDCIKGILGPVASGLGGALLGSAVPGVGTGIGFAIGLALGVVFELKGYFEGQTASDTVNAFLQNMSSGSTTIEDFATASANAFNELNSVAGIVASYGTKMEEQNAKIESCKTTIDTYIGQWEALGTISTEEIGTIITQLDMLVTASSENLGTAADILNTTLVDALQDASGETKNTYDGLLDMIFLLESNGNTVIAGWKTELYNAKEELANLDETSNTYKEDSDALMEKIKDLTTKIYGIGDSSNDSMEDLKSLTEHINGIDFSGLTDPSSAAKTALEQLTEASTAAYTEAADANQGVMNSLDEMFRYIDTNSAEWKAIYDIALDLGLPEDTNFGDTEAVKEFLKGYYEDIYQNSLSEINGLLKGSFGVISQYLGNSVLEVSKQTSSGQAYSLGEDWWKNVIFGENYKLLYGINDEEASQIMGGVMSSFYHNSITEAAEILAQDETTGPIFQALEDSMSSAEAAAALAGASEPMGEAVTGGVMSGATNAVSQGLLRSGFDTLASFIKRYGMESIDAHSPAKLTIPHGEYLAAGVAEGLTDQTAKETLKSAMSGFADLTDSALTDAFQIGRDTSKFKDKAKEMVEDLADGINGNQNPVIEAMKSMLNAMLSKIQTFVDNSRTAFNNLMSSYSSSMGSVSVNSAGQVSYNRIPYITVPKMADGGFVDQGQLFIARERGAEMVGSIGRRTAVANNDQIVQGISGGVKEGNVDLIYAIYAMADRIVEAVENNNVDVIIGDDEIGRAYDRFTRKRGVRVNSGAFADAY